MYLLPHTGVNILEIFRLFIREKFAILDMFGKSLEEKIEFLSSFWGFLSSTLGFLPEYLPLTKFNIFGNNIYPCLPRPSPRVARATLDTGANGATEQALKFNFASLQCPY